MQRALLEFVLRITHHRTTITENQDSVASLTKFGMPREINALLPRMCPYATYELTASHVLSDIFVRPSRKVTSVPDVAELDDVRFRQRSR